KNDHTVWCAGDNQYGQLGFGIAGPPRSSWMPVRDSTGAVITDAATIAAGWGGACVVRANGIVWCWGNGTTPQATQVLKTGGTALTGIVELGLGYFGWCGRDQSGGVWCAGTNAHGELGDGTTTNRNTASPVLVAPAGAPLTG